MKRDTLRKLHNSVKPHSKWVASTWNGQWGVWTEEGPVEGKHICDCDYEEAVLIAAMRNHFAEMINFMKAAENYKIEAMKYAKSAILMCKDEITRGAYKNAYKAMEDTDQIFENAYARIEKVI